MSSLINELDSMFARFDTSIKSKTEQVHQAYESNCIAIEKQFENQQVADNLSNTADKMVMTLKQHLTSKIDKINELMSLYRASSSWTRTCGKLTVDRVKKLALFGILDSFVGYEKSTMEKANNCNQFFLAFFERNTPSTSQLAYLNNLKFFKINFEKQILRLHGLYYYEVVEIYSLNNNLFLVLLVDISNQNEILFIVVNSKSEVSAVQLLEFDPTYCTYKVASPTHVDRIVVHYWRNGWNHFLVLDYNLNILFLKKKYSPRPFQSLLVNDDLIVVKNFDQFYFYDFFLCDRGNYIIDSRYARDQICQFNKNFVYLKRKLADACNRELTTIKFSIYDYKKDYCYKDFYFDFHDSSIPRHFAFQFDTHSNFYVYNYANELKIYDKHGTSLKVVQSQDVSNNETLDKLYEMRCQVINWNLPIESENIKMIYLTNSNNIFD